MPKRSAGSEDGSPHSKRQRLTDDRSLKSNVDEVLSAKKLQTLLAFSQDAGPDTKRRIQTFKIFLESIAYGQDAVIQSFRRKILLEYLNLQPISTSREENSTNAIDLIKTWSFTAQSNNEALFATVAAVLVLLLKSISHHIEFRAHGKNVCHLLLQKEQLKLFERGLSAQKSKDHLISSCLRLLTEIVSFDGGSSAKRVYRSKDTTFKRLGTFLGLRQDNKVATTSSRRKPSIRNLALRYLFANFRLQDHETKIGILGNGRILRSVFQDVREDSPLIIYEILHVIKDNVLMDEKMPRRVKGRIFTDQVLSCIATLYGYQTNSDPTRDEESTQKEESIPNLAHAFLLSICTRSEHGILIGEGLQHTGIEGEGDVVPKSQPSGSADSLYKLSSKPKAVKNHALASFLQTLRPYASDMQRDLILAIFRAAPELVSDYFHKKKSFSFDPKLTATWVGFAAFLLSTINLPIQEGIVHPEPHSLRQLSMFDIIESILPLPLSTKVISRCLSQNVALIKFFTMKILSAAFGKFAKVLKQFVSLGREADVDDETIWDKAAATLTEEFSQRCPDMSQVITVFRSCGPQDSVLQETSARLLSLYYQHLPQTALEQKFDASMALSAAFNDAVSTTRPLERSAMEPLVLEHLINVAKCSPDIRWWQKSGDDKLSLFGNGLRLCATPGNKPRRYSFEALLQTVFVKELSLHSRDASQLLAAVLRSLTQAEAWQPNHTLLGFIDDCCIRLSKKAVKYHQDLLEQLATIQISAKRDSGHPGGVLLMVIMEQWPFIEGVAIAPDLENISRWLSRFLLVLKLNDGDSGLLEHVRDRVQSMTATKKCRKLLKESSAELFDNGLSDPPVQPDNNVLQLSRTLQERIPKGVPAPQDVWQPPTPPAPENENHPGLGRWKHLDIEEAIAEGAIGDLILCLCSRHADIRKQALIEVRAWMRKLQASQYSEREILYLLAGELAETAKSSVADDALPYFAGVAAADFCLVLSNPLHNLYAKVNTFLNKAPTWKVEKMPSYWVDQILMRLPTNDDAHYKEMGWLLDLLIEGLRTNADMESYRRCHIIERLLSLLASSSLQPSYQAKLLTLLFRCSYVGGSTTLITRYSLLSWVQCLQASGAMVGSQAVALERLTQHCIASCDKERVGDWSDGKIIDTLDSEHGNAIA